MMNQVQPLIESILEEAKREAEKIQEAGRQKVRTLQEKSRTQAESRRAELREQAEQKALEEKNRQKIQAQLEMRRELLEIKSDLTKRVFATTLERLTQMESGAYQRLLVRMILEALQSGAQSFPVELVLSSRDYNRLGQDILREVKAELKKTGKGELELTLGQADPALLGGFLLRQKNIVQNYSLDNLVNSKKEELLPEIGKRLFSN